MKTPTRKKLVRVEVSGLLHYFNHSITFPADEPFICIHGPNGVGKTKLLELIHSALSGQGAALTEVPFTRLNLEFDDTTKLSIEQTCADESTPAITWRISEGGHVTTVRPDEDRTRRALIWLDREGLIRRRRAGSQIEVYVVETEELVTPAEAAVLFRDDLPSDLKPSTAPIVEFLSGAAVSLIEVGRLNGMAVPAERRAGTWRTERTVSAPEARAKDLARRILTTRAEYSQTAQLLDSSYPNRLLQIQADGPPPSASISLEHADLARHQSLLAELGLLSEQRDSLPLVDQSLETWQRAAIAMHLSDTRDKLGVFDNLLSQVQLFVDVVNSKFNHKRMQVNVHDGFAFASELGQGGTFPLLGLSSGEQHLLVVMYRLIFETTPGELVLIDEPEISLHVAWQKQFLDDLQKISRLQSVRFIVATHSPQIVGKYADHMVPLGVAE